MSSESNAYKYLILYLLPERLIRQNKMLLLQWENIKTLIPCLLESLYKGDVEVKLSELDKVFTGIIKLRERLDGNVLGKVASLWYYLTRVFHQSIGPRVGNFVEELISYWIEQEGNYKVVGRNVTLKEAFEKLGISGIENRSKIDFVLESDSEGTSGKRLALIEVRMSEHTGGRTAQESLLDKIVYTLNILEEQKIPLREKLLNKGIQEVALSIAILFSEHHELLNEKNFNKGRLDSLINYIMDKRHVWGAVKGLSDHGYKFCDGSPIAAEKIRRELSNPKSRKICIQDSRASLRVWLKILFGDEFFKEYVGSSLNKLLTDYASLIADDIWLFYTVTINELKVAAELGQTHVRRIYEDLLKNPKMFERFINEIYNNANLSSSLDNYVDSFNQWIEECANSVIRTYKERNEELRLLETNDVVAGFEYLKQLCICALAEYFTLNYKGDREFKTCLWKVGEDKGRKRRSSL